MPFDMLQEFLKGHTNQLGQYYNLRWRSTIMLYIKIFYKHVKILHVARVKVYNQISYAKNERHFKEHEMKAELGI